MVKENYEKFMRLNKRNRIGNRLRIATFVGGLLLATVHDIYPYFGYSAANDVNQLGHQSISVKNINDIALEERIDSLRSLPEYQQQKREYDSFNSWTGYTAYTLIAGSIIWYIVKKRDG